MQNVAVLLRNQRRGILPALLVCFLGLAPGFCLPIAAVADTVPLPINTLANDDVATAAIVSGPLPYTDSGSTVAAVRSETDPHIAGYDTNTVWYKYTPLTSGYVQANTFGSDYDTTLGVYTVTAGGVYTEVAANDDANGGGSQSRVDFYAAAGTTYWFMAAAYSEGGGTLQFTVQPGLPPAAIQLLVNTTGLIPPKSGAATVAVRFAADQPVFVNGCAFSLRQRGTVSQFSFGVNAFVAGRDWLFTFQDPAGRAFISGKATLTANVYYQDPIYGYQIGTVEQEVTLKKEK